MSSVERLLDEYMKEHQSGGVADPVAYLERAAPEDRPELAALIEGYLARAPRQPFDEAAFRDSPAEGTVEALERSLGGAGGLWPALLPRLRARAGFDGVSSWTASPKCSMSETGAPRSSATTTNGVGVLPASGVSDRLLQALAKLIGSTAAELRDAGAALGTGGQAQAGASGALPGPHNATQPHLHPKGRSTGGRAVG